MLLYHSDVTEKAICDLFLKVKTRLVVKLNEIKEEYTICNVNRKIYLLIYSIKNRSTISYPKSVRPGAIHFLQE